MFDATSRLRDSPRVERVDLGDDRKRDAHFAFRASHFSRPVGKDGSDARRTVVIDRDHALRLEAETLVTSIFDRAYQALPAAFPRVMADYIEIDQRLSAACGLHFSSDGFFSAIYLEGSVTEVVSRTAGVPVQASEIVEVTSLGSATRRA